jgi:hypothetical protein
MTSVGHGPALLRAESERPLTGRESPFEPGAKRMICTTLRASSIKGSAAQASRRASRRRNPAPFRGMAEITRHECVGPAGHGGLEHEFVSPLKPPASIKAAAARR